MARRRSIPQAVVGLLTAVVLLALPVGMPLLDVGQFSDVVVMSDGQTAEGAAHHDHTACMLYGSAPWSPMAATEPPSPRPVLDQSSPTEQYHPRDRAHLTLTRSRAPPSA